MELLFSKFFQNEIARSVLAHIAEGSKRVANKSGHCRSDIRKLTPYWVNFIQLLVVDNDNLYKYPRLDLFTRNGRVDWTVTKNTSLRSSFGMGDSEAVKLSSGMSFMTAQTLNCGKLEKH